MSFLDNLAAAAHPNNSNFTMADLVASDGQKENAGQKENVNEEPNRTVVVLNQNNRLGSVYKAVAKALARQGGWSRKKKATGRYHMIFGEAQGAGIPYKRFSQVFRYDYGITPLCNYYRSFKAVTDKVMLCQTIKQWATENDEDASFLPESFLFWPGKEDVSQHKQFLDAFSRNSQKAWIVKPANSSHGEKIFISRSSDEIIDHIDGQREGSGAWVVSKYCENPMLLEGGRKFDIRMWVLADHEYGIHIYREGVCRSSSVPFSMDDLKNKFIHLTNHSIQEEHPDFGKHEEGNEMFFRDFAAFLESSTKFTLRDDIMPQIKRIVKSTLVAGKPIMEGIDGVDDYKSFMFFGFDFMVDSDGQVSLLEVNGAPAVAKALLPQLAQDLIATAIDPVFPRVSGDIDGGKVADSAFERIYTSKGKCDHVQNMPAPTTGLDETEADIQQFGADEEGAEAVDEGKRAEVAVSHK
jgi:tubulin--tyrosine ligase